MNIKNHNMQRDLPYQSISKHLEQVAKLDSFGVFF